MKIKGAVFLSFAAFAFISCRADATRPGGSGASPGGEMSSGRKLFLKNCAHCHGADARGDEGPDLHKLDLSDEWISNRIRNGKPGEMTAFAGKLQPSEISALASYVQTLK
jgi:cytochrome c oxidase cbb3-type subunit 3